MRLTKEFKYSTIELKRHKISVRFLKLIEIKRWTEDIDIKRQV